MKPRVSLAFATLILLQFAFLSPSRASDMVSVDAKYKKDTTSAPEPEYPVVSRNKGQQGQGIYRMVVNDRTGIVSEVKIMKRTGFRELDACAIMTFFQWKFRPGAVKQRDVAVNFHLTGWSQDIHR